MSYLSLLQELEPIAHSAGQAIMQIYSQQLSGERKSDGSPVTEADTLAEAIILEGLVNLAPDIPIVSEENAASHSLDPPERYFLVDPLDGTREFLKYDGKGAFTVNIALIEHARPVAGLIFAPAHNTLYSGVVGEGAFEDGKPIRARKRSPDALTALISVSHLDEETQHWLVANPVSGRKSIGSSLKFGLLAAGLADVYPRFSPTMEWDTAAGQAILSAAGGRVQHPDGSDFTYGKDGFRNGPFIAWGAR